jgi:uncharacterized RDD family membrane protein YckC
VTAHVAPERDLRLQGHYAGIVSRLASFLVDAFVVVTLFSLGGQVLEFLVKAVGSEDFTFSDRPLANAVALAAWAFLYAFYPLYVAGRTFGMAVFGLRAVATDGSDLDGRHAALRVLAFPLSFLLLGFGFLLILLRRDRRALHDLIATSAVVYSWDARAARLRFLAKRATQSQERKPQPTSENAGQVS